MKDRLRLHVNKGTGTDPILATLIVTTWEYIPAYGRWQLDNVVEH